MKHAIIVLAVAKVLENTHKALRFLFGYFDYIVLRILEFSAIRRNSKLFLR